MSGFSAKNRQAMLETIQQDVYDVLVIGGGITGAGIALDAVSRGLKVCLVEMQDFAGGTSSRSTRLIHGGLRYLKQFEFKLVAEVAKEREIIFRNAPHLVKPEHLLLPITTKGSFGKFMTRLGMWMYEVLAGVKKEERHQFLDAGQTLKLEPLLRKEDLLGGILYYEYRTDDARLTLSILKEAVSRGATALSYLKVTGFIYANGKINGAKAEDQLDKRSLQIKSNFVINASGPWVDELDTLDDQKQGNKLQLTKGVHLVFDHKKLPLNNAVYFDTPDKRMIFALPHRGKTYVGTTDTFYNGDKVNPVVTDEDKLYLLKCVNNYFDKVTLLPGDILSSWAGLRPLIRKQGKKPSEISRKDETFVWGSGLISIAGGKLTGYRKMAQRVVDLVGRQMLASGKKVSACMTGDIRVSGGNTGDFLGFLKTKIPVALSLGLSKQEAEMVISRYGSETDQFLALVRAVNEKEPSHELPFLLRAGLHYAVVNEMCLTPVDFFMRRTGMLYFEIEEVVRFQKPLIKYMRNILNWSDAQMLEVERGMVGILHNTASSLRLDERAGW